MAKIEMEFPASYKLLGPIHSFTEKLLEIYSTDEKARAVFPLAVQEILANIVEHSYGGREGQVRIIWEVDRRRIKVSFYFGGKKIRVPEEEFDLEKKVRERRARGFGLEIVRRISDRMEYGFKEGKNWWEVERKFRG